MMTTKIIFDMFIKEIIKNTKISVYTVNKGIRADMLCFYAYSIWIILKRGKKKRLMKEIFTLVPEDYLLPKSVSVEKKITPGADYK